MTKLSAHYTRTRRRTVTFAILFVLIHAAVKANWSLLEEAFYFSNRETIAEKASLTIWKQFPSSYESGAALFRVRVAESKRQWEKDHPVRDSTTFESPRIATAMPNHTRYYFLHIPKAGGNSMRNKLSRNGACVVDSGPRAPVSHFAKWTHKHPHHRVFMTEGLGFNRGPRPLHNFVMFRNPQSHVLSQFFHCTESKPHRRKSDSMPNSLLEWLQAWEHVRQNTTLAQQKSTSESAHLHWADQRFKCYNPIDLQSWLLGYPDSKKRLESRFDAVGILSEFYLSSCVFSTIVLQHVPPACDCARFPQKMTDTNNGDKSSSYNKSDHKDGTEKTHSGTDHGVTHHGDSFQPSEEEMQLIRNLTQHDQILYNNAEEMFYRQVAELEQQHQVKLCRAPPPRLKRPGQGGARPCKPGWDSAL